jgi:hypothetical protein
MSLHGIADYVVGLFVIALPFILNLEVPASWFFIVIGVVAISYSLLTDYEFGVVRVLPIRFHLILDAVFGLLLLLGPWLLDLPQNARWLSYVVGALALVLVATTRLRA